MSSIELFVGFKIPDTTAITAFHTIEKLGYSELKKLKREIYYKFYITGNADKFSKKIAKTDILVNANKNNYRVKKEGEQINRESEDLEKIHILVKDIGDSGVGILKTLRERLGLKEINKMEKGIFWTLFFDCGRERAGEIAGEISKKLLYNENYQECRIL